VKSIAVFSASRAPVVIDSTEGGHTLSSHPIMRDLSAGTWRRTKFFCRAPALAPSPPRPTWVYNSRGPHSDLFRQRSGATPLLLKTAPNRCSIGAMATAWAIT